MNNLNNEDKERERALMKLFFPQSHKDFKKNSAEENQSDIFNSHTSKSRKNWKELKDPDEFGKPAFVFRG
jgi:hypothetical protein